MKHSPPEVSIVIPTYNARDFIEQTIESALSQEGVSCEVIVVDDGSSDGTADIASKIDGVQVIRQQNARLAGACETGRRASRGEYLVFLDHDDILRPSAASDHLAVLSARPEVPMVFGSNDLMDEHGAVFGVNSQTPREFSMEDVVMGTTPSFSQCCYRRSALEEIGGFDATVRNGADHDLHIRLLRNRFSGYCHGKTVNSRRIHSAQMTRSPSKLYLAHMSTLRRHLGPDGSLPNPELLRRASRHWRRYYGQFIPSEAARMTRIGKLGDATDAAFVFLSCLPESLFGASKYIWNRLAANSNDRATKRSG